MTYVSSETLNFSLLYHSLLYAAATEGSDFKLGTELGFESNTLIL